MNRLSQLITGAAVIAIALVFVVNFGPQTGAQGPSIEISCAVEVHGNCIKSTEFWAAYRLIAPRNADAERLKQLGLRQLAADGLYERWLLNEDAKRLGITVSDDDINQELVAGRAHVSLPVDSLSFERTRQLTYMLGLPGDGENFRVLDVLDRKTKKFDKKRYERDVRLMTKLSPSDFRDFQKRELVASRMRDLIRARVRVSEDEAYQTFARERSTRTIDYVRFDRRFYADLVVDASPTAVQAFADQNKDELDKVWEARKSQYLPECRVARHVLARVKSGEEDAEAEKTKAKAKIARAQALLKEGVSFSDVAKRLSDDTSASRGGDLGCVSRGKMVKPFEDKLFELKVDEISEPVESEFGFHLIQVTQIASGEDTEKVARAQLARELFLQQEADRLAAEGAKQVLAATSGGKPIQEALDTYLANLTEAAKAAKGGDKKGPKPAAKPETKPEAKPEGEAAADEVKENEQFTFATHPHRPSVEASLPFGASGTALPSAQDGAGTTRKIFELAKVGDVLKDMVQLTNGYAVVQLKDITAVTDEQWQKDKELYLSGMRTAKQADAVLNYVRRLKSTLGSEVKFDRRLTTEPKGNEGGEEPPMGDME
ncbi:peptidylprolyl isomerase [Chondromyces crocatus]|uniref:Foldase n=1 Tax=Chondromyces crocatus TaxID=52 RepID=A0A0K1EKL9_CHOCO|nr:peptidylprolyl isomerase [Chondromyces crocatus]AKT41396.1 foldase [Chondromyces crocatus]